MVFSELKFSNKLLKGIKNLFQKTRIDYAKLDLSHLTAEKQRMWEERIKDVLSCPDNSLIPRHKDAGKIRRGKLIMHNGLKIDPLSYGGYAMLKLLIENHGVHEPQEEFVFKEVLKKLPQKALMVELGSFWAFYSMWFYNEVSEARCIMIEPNKECLKSGKKNFKLNGMKGKFIQAAFGNYSGDYKSIAKIETIDKLIKEHGINKIDVLHADIQGVELDMLKGSENALISNKIGYVFISTHSEELHKETSDFLLRKNYIIIASASPKQSYSFDGVLVAVNKNYPYAINPLNISQKLLH